MQPTALCFLPPTIGGTDGTGGTSQVRGGFSGTTGTSQTALLGCLLAAVLLGAAAEDAHRRRDGASAVNSPRQSAGTSCGALGRH